MCFAVSLGAFAQDEVNNTGKKIEANHMEFSDTRKTASNELPYLKPSPAPKALW